MQPDDSRTVILLHGLLRTRRSMWKMERALRASGWKSVERFGYRSTCGSISQHSAALRSFVEDLGDRTRLSFVGHSMGNIVLRCAIGDWQRDSDRMGVLSRLDRIVMLGPPNQGAIIARKLARTGVFGWFAGPAAMELGPDWESIRERLAIPPCPFAIVAGDLSERRLMNPLVTAPSDLIVSVEECGLDGAAERISFPIAHALLTVDRRVIEYVIGFLGSQQLSVSQPLPVGHSTENR